MAELSGDQALMAAFEVRARTSRATGPGVRRRAGGKVSPEAAGQIQR